VTRLTQAWMPGRPRIRLSSASARLEPGLIAALNTSPPLSKDIA
jgi:hypothetical protein